MCKKLNGGDFVFANDYLILTNVTLGINVRHITSYGNMAVAILRPRTLVNSRDRTLLETNSLCYSLKCCYKTGPKLVLLLSAYIWILYKIICHY